MRFNRHLDKLIALARPKLPPEVLLPELIYFIGRVLRASSLPAFLVSEPGQKVEDFIVWRGSETIIQEIRVLLAAGFWPAPPSVPPLGTLLANPGERRVHAATLWGEGCAEDGPWGDLWKARDVRHGLQGVCVDASGRVGVMLVSRNNASPPFSSDDIAFVEAAIPILVAAMNPYHSKSSEQVVLSQQSHFLFDSEGKLSATGVLGLEVLRDIGGGGPNGVSRGRESVEAFASKLAQHGSPYADSFEDQIMHLAYGDGALATEAARSTVFAENAFGTFELELHPLVGLQDGAKTILGILKRFEPSSLLAVHAASTTPLSARETDLLLALVMGDTMKSAAARMQVSYSTIKTLLTRLMGRFCVNDRLGLLNAVLSIGRGDDLYAHWNQPI